MAVHTLLDPLRTEDGTQLAAPGTSRSNHGITQQRKLATELWLAVTLFKLQVD
ncbi:MAG: hypothetical protein IPP36_13120 [Nitrosomonadales bacterium]|nr:hypothetical protein [Nitrosomonadales bacterium]